MRFREFVTLLTPPLFVKAGRRITRMARPHMGHSKSGPIALPEWEYIAEGWAYTHAHSEVRGWNVESVLQTYQQKWTQYVQAVQGTGPLGVAHESNLTTNEDINSHNTIMTFAYALALAARRKERISLLDWGGGIGHYYIVAQALLPEVEIEYHCKDVPVLADYGATLFPAARFHTDNSCLERTYDFVLASASLHYSEDWQTAFAGLAAASGDFLFVSRLPTVLHAPDYVFVQRPYAYGYDTEYLGWCLNRTAFLSQAALLGLRTVREFAIGERPPIVNAPEPCQYRGFLFHTCGLEQER